MTRLIRGLNRLKDILKRLIHVVQSEDIQTLKNFRDMMPYQSNFTDECHDKNVSIIREEYMEKGVMKRRL